jgi:NTP pyrophosphatase (non-canonical NTP hydrolase)
MHDMSVPKGDRTDWPSLIKKIQDTNLHKDTLDEVLIVSPKACYANGEFHGWHTPSNDLKTDLLLMHCELSEAVEALRHNKLRMSDGDGSVVEELADVILYIFHTSEKNGLDIIDAVYKKHKKNLNRPYRHGGKKF